MTLLRPAVLCSGFLASLGAFHAPRLPPYPHARPCLHGVGKRRLRQGQRDDRHGARAAGARSDQRAGGGDRRGHALQHLRGPDEDQRGLLGHAASGREMGLLARSQDPDLHAQAERQVSGRRAVLVEGRQIFLRALRRDGIDKQGQGLLRLDRIDRHARSDDGGAQVQAAELRGAVSSGHGYRGHPRREERDGRSHQSRRHRTLQALLLGKGLVDHARQVGRLSRRGEDPARSRDLPLHLRSLGRGRGDARRRRRRVPALRQ